MVLQVGETGDFGDLLGPDSLHLFFWKLRRVRGEYLSDNSLTLQIENLPRSRWVFKNRRDFCAVRIIEDSQFCAIAA